MTNVLEFTFEDVIAAERGKIFFDGYESGVRFLIVRGGASVCAYVGVPTDHPLAGHDYDNIPLDCHGGLTFAGTTEKFPSGYYWYGWDYAHCGDYCVYDAKYKDKNDDKKWTPEEVRKDAWTAIWQFKQLMALTEKVSKSASPSGAAGKGEANGNG